MHRALYPAVGVLISFCPANASGAEQQALPAILAPRLEHPVPPPPPGPRHSFISDRVNGLVRAAVLSRTASNPLFISGPGEAVGAGSAPIIMEQLIVTVPRFLDELPTPISKLDRFRKDGVFYKHVGRKFTLDGMLYLDRWYSNRQGSGGVETRAELKFNLRW